jgi:transcriptional regulator with XRE-family HTH domain
MNMILNTKEEIQKAFYYAFSSYDSKEDLEHDTKMLMYRFLSEVERLSEEKGLNRKELASLIGTSASYITQLFRGTKMMNLETIAKFQKVLEVNFEIKAISNNASKAYININLKDICNSQKEIQGFWTFHKLNPSYDTIPENKPVLELNDKKEIA